MSEIAERVRKAHDLDAMVELCKALIRIPSFTSEETPAVEYLEPYFRSRGYVVNVQEISPGRKQIAATLKGAGGGKNLMFNGHIDIDPVAAGWTRDPWEPVVDGDRLYGAGSFNMKGGVSAMIEAAEMIRRSGVKLRGDIVIACVAGELQAGVGTVYMMEHGPKADVAVVTEPYGKDNILTVHAGVMQFAIHTLGQSQHIALGGPGIDAIEKAMKARQAVQAMKFTYTPFADLPDLPKVRLGAIIGGQGRDYSLRGPQFTSDFCTVLGDVRFVPGMSVESIIADMRTALDAVAAGDPDFRYEIEMPPPAVLNVGGAVMQPFDLPRDEPVLQQVIGAYRDVMDRDPRTPGGSMPPMSYAGNDTTHLWAAGIPCVLYGPGGEMGNATAPDHYTRIDHMSVVARVLATAAVEICG